MQYTTSFRNSVLKKILPPSNRSVSSVSKETGVAVVTINNWHGLHSEHLPLFRQELNEQFSAGEKMELLINGKVLKERFQEN